MTFESQYYLWLLFILPIFFILMVYSWLAFKKFANSPAHGLFAYKSNTPSLFTRIIIGLTRLLAIATIIIGLAEPSINIPTQEIKYKDIRLFFLMDVSGSMLYAEDVKPNRLVAVRNEIVAFMKKLEGNYETSIIPFAGTANPYYCPLTYSSNIYTTLMEKLGPEAAPTNGTNMTAAFLVLEKAVKEGVNIVFLVTDGGKEEADATNRVELNKLIHKLDNCFVHTVGVGGIEPCPLIKRSRSGAFIEYAKEDDGRIATSRLDEDILKQIAENGRGTYLHFEENKQLSQFLDKAVKENRVAGIGEINYKRLSVQHYCFAIAALLFWCCFLVNYKHG